MSTVNYVFRDRSSATQAITQLEAVGITESQISLLMTDDARGKHFAIQESSKVDEGVAAGASLGGLAGVIAGAALAAGAIAIPGLNLVVTGALISSLAGLGAGAVSGGLIGGLIGSGVPEHEAKLYEKEIRAGNVLVSVNTLNHDQTKTVKDIFDRSDSKRAAA